MNTPNYLDDWKAYWTEHRTYLLAFAFRMTGSLAEAEDIVQDAFIECAEVDPKSIHNPKSWLTKVCSNKGLDHLKRAYKKREVYVGTWLPDALPEAFDYWAEFKDDLETRETLTTSFLLLMERLGPEERVVYLLSEILEYSYQEIAGFLKKSDGSCRKIAQRGREALKDFKVKQSFPTEEAYSLLGKFFESAKVGDTEAMEKLLSKDSQFWGDGGGKVSAINRILDDKMQIAGVFKNLGKIFASLDFKLEFQNINQRPGLMISRRLPDGSWVIDTIMTFEVDHEGIQRIFAQRNPDKLSFLNVP